MLILNMDTICDNFDISEKKMKKNEDVDWTHIIRLESVGLYAGCLKMYGVAK